MAIVDDGRTGWFTAVRRGAALRCPNCGGDRILHRYLKVVDGCTRCGEPYGHLRADDAPPWLTILIVGHIVMPLLLYVEQTWHLPIPVQMAIWPPLTLVLTLLMLPRCKGVVLAYMWAIKAEGTER